MMFGDGTDNPYEQRNRAKKYWSEDKNEQEHRSDDAEYARWRYGDYS